MINRKILASMVVIGLVGAVAGSGTLAYFNDTEESTGNTFEAGALDMQVAWNYTYDGAQEQAFASQLNEDDELVTEQGSLDGDAIYPRAEFGDQPGVVFDISDVKPGDSSEGQFHFNLSDNPGYVYGVIRLQNNYENGCTEPEEQVDGNCGNAGPGQGELPQNMEWTLEDEQGNEIQSGTVSDLAGPGYVPIEGDRSSGAFSAGTPHTLNFNWKVDGSVGNEIQTDSIELAFGLYTEQERNNEDETDTIPSPSNVQTVGGS